MTGTGFAELVEGLREHLSSPDATLRICAVTDDWAEQLVLRQSEPARVAGADEQLFELASLTKVLTSAILLQCMEISLETTVPELVPDAVGNNPLWADVTLGKLARHRAQLPRLPRGMVRRAMLHRNDPYAGYEVAELFKDMRRQKRDTETGYSNYGYAVLSVCLQAAAESDYPTLLDRYVAQPLALPSLTTDLTRTEARGHTIVGRVVRPWRQGAFLGAGGVLCDAADFLSLVTAVRSACLNDAENVLTDTFRPPDGGEPLAWQRTPAGLLWHNGATSGFRSFVAVNPSGRTALGMQVNQAAPGTIDNTLLDLLTKL